MRHGLIGTGAGVVLALVGWSLVAAGPPTEDSRGRATGGSRGVIAFSSSVDRHTQLLFLVDEQRQWFGVYQLDLDTGEVSLKVARNYRFDLELKEWGEQTPKVESVQAMAGKRASQH